MDSNNLNDSTPTENAPDQSYFDGGLLQLIAWRIAGFFVTLFTLGICTPWAVCMIYRWTINHTVINGKRLNFTGSAISLFGQWIKWWLLSLITLGIYALWLPIKLEQWKVKNTSFAQLSQHTHSNQRSASFLVEQNHYPCCSD